MRAVSYSRAAELEGVTEQAVKQRVWRESVRKVETGERHGNGKPVMGVPVCDLSEEAQRRYWRERAEEQGRRLMGAQGAAGSRGGTAGERTGEIAAAPSGPRNDSNDESASSPSAPRNDGDREPRSATHNSAPAHQPQRADLRGIPITRDGVPDERAMRAWGMDSQAETYGRRMRAVSRLESLLERADYGEVCETRQRVANEYGVSARTLKRWRDWKEEYGPAGLVPAPSGQRGRYRSIPDALGRACRDFYLQQNRPTKAQVYRQVVIPWCRERDMSAPHYSTVRRYLDREVWPVEETAMREGEHEWRARCHPKVKREYPDVNQYWVSDHRKLDTFVLANGKAKRPWITAIVDWGSAAWISWRISLRPSADTVAHALRNALLQVGCPEAFYRDNGKEFVAKRLGGQPDRNLRKPSKSDVEGVDRWPAELPTDVLDASVWDALGIDLTTALPYRSWSKQIEPMFNSYASRYENLIPGWCGRNAQDKPANLKQLKENDQLLTLEQFGEVFARVARRLNTERPVGEREKPPLAYYEAYEPDVPDPQSLSVCLQDVREEKVGTQGITIQHRRTKHRFYSPDIARYVGMRLTVAWDPADASHCYAYTPDERVLAVPRAQDADPMSYGEPNKAAQRGGRVQKARIQEVQGDIRGAAGVEHKDPTGAFRMIEARHEGEASGGRERDRLPEAEAEAERQREAREDAEQRKTGTDDGPERNRYSDIVDLI